MYTFGTSVTNADVGNSIPRVESDGFDALVTIRVPLRNQLERSRAIEVVFQG